MMDLENRGAAGYRINGFWGSWMKNSKEGFYGSAARLRNGFSSV